MVNTKFQAAVPSGYGKEYFTFEAKFPAAVPFWSQGLPLGKTWYRTANDTYQISSN